MCLDRASAGDLAARVAYEVTREDRDGLKFVLLSVHKTINHEYPGLFLQAGRSHLSSQESPVSSPSL